MRDDATDPAHDARLTPHDPAPLPIIKKESPRRSARCDEEPPAGLLTGIAQFNAGEYWECHETLEELWRPEPDHIRYLYQGILQIGVGFYHLRRGNWRGAVNKLRSGNGYLAPSTPTCLGIDVARLRDEAGAILAALDALGPARLAEYDATHAADRPPDRRTLRTERFWRACRERVTLTPRPRA